MKTMKKVLLIALAICMLPMYAFALKRGDPGYCKVTSELLESKHIHTADKYTDETNTDGSGSSDITSEDSDTEYKYPSIFIHDDGTIEINGVKYPVSILKLESSLKDVTGELLDATDEDDDLRIYKEIFGIDGDVFSEILGDVDFDNFDIEDIKKDWEEALERIRKQKEEDDSLRLDEEEWEKKKDLISGKDIKDMLDEFKQNILDWLAGIDITIAQWNGLWDTITSQSDTEYDQLTQRIALADATSYEGGTVAASPNIVNMAGVESAGSLEHDNAVSVGLGAQTYTVSFITPEAKANRDRAREVQKIMDDDHLPLSRAVGEFVTGYIQIDGNASALQQYAEDVADGKVADTADGFLRALIQDMPLISTYYAWVTSPEYGKNTGSMGVWNIPASFYLEHKDDLNIQITPELIENVRLVYTGDSAGSVLGYFVDPSVMMGFQESGYRDNKEARTAEAKEATQALVDATNEQIRESEYVHGTMLTQEEYDKRLEYATFVFESGLLSNYRYQFTENGVDPTRKADAEAMRDYWVGQAAAETDPAKKAEYESYANAFTEIAKYNQLDADRQKADNATIQPTWNSKESGVPIAITTKPITGTRPWQEGADYYSWSKYENGIGDLRASIDISFWDAQRTDQNGQPTVESMEMLGLSTDGIYEMDYSFDLTNDNYNNLFIFDSAFTGGKEGRYDNNSLISLIYAFPEFIQGTDEEVQEKIRLLSEIDAGNVSFEVNASGRVENTGYQLNQAVGRQEEAADGMLQPTANTNNYGTWTPKTLNALVLYNEKVAEDRSYIASREELNAYAGIPREHVGGDWFPQAYEEQETVNVGLGYWVETSDGHSALDAAMSQGEEKYEYRNGSLYKGDKLICAATPENASQLVVIDENGNKKVIWENKATIYSDDIEVLDEQLDVRTGTLNDFFNESEGSRSGLYGKIGRLESGRTVEHRGSLQYPPTTGEDGTPPQREDYIQWSIDSIRTADSVGGTGILPTKTSAARGILIKDNKNDIYYVSDIVKDESAKVYYAALNNMFLITLPDGTKVYVDHDSALQYYKDAAQAAGINPAYIVDIAQPDKEGEDIVIFVDKTAMIEGEVPAPPDPDMAFNHITDDLKDMFTKFLKEGRSIFEEWSYLHDKKGKTEEEISQYEKLTILAKTVTDYYNEHREEITEEEYGIIKELIDIAEEIESEENDDGSETQENGSDDTHPEGDTGEGDGTNPSEDGDGTTVEVKKRVSEELIEYLISLGIPVEDIPTDISLEWLKEKIGVEEIKKFFSNRTVLLSHYVTIKKESTVIDNEEWLNMGSGLYSWKVTTTNPSGGYGCLGGTDLTVYCNADITDVTASTRVQKTQVLKIYYTVEETLVAEPYGWVVSHKELKGTGVDNDPNGLVMKQTQVLENSNFVVGSWHFVVDEEDEDNPNERDGLDGTRITTILWSGGGIGTWVNGVKITELIQVTISGEREQINTFRIK